VTAGLPTSQETNNYGEFWILKEELVSNDTEQRTGMKWAWINFLAGLKRPTHLCNRARCDAKKMCGLCLQSGPTVCPLTACQTLLTEPTYQTVCGADGNMLV
jgi:hypothetical protein